MSIDLASLDWEALARPDPEGRGARLARRLADRWTGRWSGSTALGGPGPGEPTLFDGGVALRHAWDRCHLPRYHNGELDHPNLAAAEALVRRWPAGFGLAREAIEVFNPITDEAVPESTWGRALGSSSHFDKRCLGLVFATYYDPFGLAQAFVHEAAHQKLFGLGVRIEDAEHLVSNPASELYPSPVVDRPRPMTAVVHAQFSFMHVTALDIVLVETAADARERDLARRFLARNVERMERGYRTLADHAQVDEPGAQFMAGFMAWSREVLDRGAALVSA